MYPTHFQESARTAPEDFGLLLEAVPDLELWLRGRSLVFHGAFEVTQLEHLRRLCREMWPVETANFQADVAVSLAVLSSSLLHTLALHVRVGGTVVLLDTYTMSISRNRFEALVAPTALEIVRYSLPHALPVLRRGRRPVCCILRRRN